MKTLYLEDLKGLSEQDVKSHIASEYSNYGNSEESSALGHLLQDYDVLVAYESVGSWGCDSSSWFLLKNKKDGQLYEVNGSHCSCYGFEGQFEPEKTSVEYLKSDKFYFYTGGYDGNETENKQVVLDYIQALD